MREEPVTARQGRETETSIRNRETRAMVDRGLSPTAKRLLLVGVIVFGIALCLPLTGWILRQQLAMAVGNRLPGSDMWRCTMGEEQEPPDPSLGAQATAARHLPDDLAVQIAAATQVFPYLKVPNTDRTERANHVDAARVTHLLALKKRFNDRPELQATILCYLSGSILAEIAIRRNEVDRIPNADQRAEYTEKRRRRDPLRLAQYEEVTRQGEVCDPDNAFFPQMLALVLFESHRDREALDALHQAAKKTLWTDYASTETRGHLRLLERTRGQIGVLEQEMVAGSLTLPHLASVRSMAYVAVSLAMQKEKAGDHEGGFAIRQDLSRIGALMRVRSKSLTASFLGIAITDIAAIGPEGRLVPKAGQGRDRENARRTEAYIAYLDRIGHSEEAVWYLAEREKGKKVKQISEQGLGEGHSVLERLTPLLRLWGIGLLLLVNLGTMLLFGGASALITRLPRFRQALPLPYGVRLGLIASGLAGMAWLYSEEKSRDAQTIFDTQITLTGIALIALTIFISLLKRKSKGAFGRELLGFILTFAGAAIVVGGVGRGLDYVTSGFATFLPFMIPGSSDARVIFVPLLLCPLLYTGVAVLRAKHQGLPCTVAIVRTLRNGMIGACGVLLMLTAVTAIAVARTEKALRQELNEVIEHDGQYMARQIGVPWPEAVNEKAIRKAMPQARSENGVGK